MNITIIDPYTQFDDPSLFLNWADSISPYAALVFASQWTDRNTVATDDQYYAGEWFLKTQTVVPNCDFCTWPVMPGLPHTFCDSQLDQADAEAYESDYVNPDDRGDDLDRLDDNFPVFDDEDAYPTTPTVKLRDIDDDYPDEDYCDGCGERGNGCVCAELASLRQYNATPLEERCGPWTA